jgi:hypothetical protein
MIQQNSKDAIRREGLKKGVSAVIPRSSSEGGISPSGIRVQEKFLAALGKRVLRAFLVLNMQGRARRKTWKVMAGGYLM